MATYYVACINKHPTHQDPHRRIQFVGTNKDPNATTASRRWTVDEVIDAIREGHAFYCEDRETDENVLVIIATHLGHEYIKTENDGLRPDNLLAQRECKWKKK